MSTWANGMIYTQSKKLTPADIDALEEEFDLLSASDDTFEFTFEGNWYFDSILSIVQQFEKKYDWAEVNYYSDEDGDQHAEYKDGEWHFEDKIDAWPSDLPNDELFPTKRVREIINIIADDDMACSDSEHIRDLLFNKCKLTDKEVFCLGLQWLKDLIE